MGKTASFIRQTSTAVSFFALKTAFGTSINSHNMDNYRPLPKLVLAKVLPSY
jgi:hypothetical protein